MGYNSEGEDRNRLFYRTRDSIVRIVRSFLWLAVVSIVAMGLWLVGRESHESGWLGDWTISIFLFGMGVLLGIRIGSSYATQFVRDLLRLNRCQTDQYNELSEMNLRMLKELSSREDSKSKSVSESSSL